MRGHSQTRAKQVSERFRLSAALDEQSVVTPSATYESTTLGGSVLITGTTQVLRSKPPVALLSFNAPIGGVQDYGTAIRLWTDGKFKANIVEYMKPFAGAYIRYPGGTPANQYDWAGATASTRTTQALEASFTSTVLFGFYELMAQMPWLKPIIIMNVRGWGSSWPVTEFTNANILNDVRTNAHLWQRYISDPIVEIGNELYAVTGWGENVAAGQTYAYVERCQPIVNLLDGLLPGAKLLVPLVENNDYNRTRAQWNPVLAAMTRVDGMVLHSYSDGVEVANQISQINNAISDWETVNGAGSARVFITEHAAYQSPANRATAAVHGGLKGAITVADHIIAFSQKPQIDMACVHSFAGVSWPMFDSLFVNGDMEPMPVYWAMRILRKVIMENTLGTTTVTDNQSGYASAHASGGYDCRGAVFKDAGATMLGFAVVNRHTAQKNITLRHVAFANASVSITRYALYGGAGDTIQIRAKSDISVDASDNSFNSTTAGKFSVFTAGMPIIAGGFAQATNSFPQDSGGVVSSVSGDGKKMIVSGVTLVTEGVAANAGVSSWYQATLAFPVTEALLLVNVEAPAESSGSFDGSGDLALTVPPSSVCGFVIKKT